MHFTLEKSRSAFTLVEIIVVIVIVSVLSTIALPKMTTVIERFQAKEGEQILLAFYGAEQRFAMENSRRTCSAYPCALWTSSLTALDVTARTTPKFGSPYFVGGSPQVIRIDRLQQSSTLYTLAIGFDGKITCLNNATLCAKMKYN